MEVGKVEYYNKALGGLLPNHMAMYYQLHGYIPIATSDKIFTGTCLLIEINTSNYCKKGVDRMWMWIFQLAIVNRFLLIHDDYWIFTSMDTKIGSPTWILYSRGRVWVQYLSFAVGHRQMPYRQWPTQFRSIYIYSVYVYVLFISKRVWGHYGELISVKIQ